MTRSQLENLIEYYLVMYVNAYNDTLSGMSPDYLVEKFTKYIGPGVTPTVRPFWDQHEREYKRYCQRWHFESEPLVKQIFMALSDREGRVDTPDALMIWFDKYFSDHASITTDRYSHMNIKIKVEMYDKLLATPPFARYLKILALGV